MSSGFSRKHRRSPQSPVPANHIPGIPASPSIPSVVTVERKRGRRVPKPISAPTHNGADLSLLLNAGPTYLPYSTAWTDSRTEQVKHFRHWIYIAIDSIASAVAHTAPNLSYVRSDSRPALLSKGINLLPRGVCQRALAPLRSHDSLEPVPASHPLAALLADPNEPDTSYDLWYETVLFYLLTGTAYWWMPRNDLGVPYAIFIVPSHWVWPIAGKAGVKAIESYELRPTEGNYLRRLIPAEEIVVFRRKSPVSKLDGFSPLTAMSAWGDVQESIDRSRWHSYKRGTFPTVAIQFDGTVQDPTQETLDRIASKFLARYTGEANFNKPLFLPPGVTVKPLVIKPSEMLWGESAQEIRNNILATFRVPPASVGLGENQTYGANRASDSAFFQKAVNPPLRFFGTVLTEKVCPLFTSPDEPMRAWWEDQTPQDPEIVERQITTDLMGASISPNEIRALRGREPYPYDWADQPLRPLNMDTMSGAFGGAHAKPDPKTPMPNPHVSDET